MGSGGLGIRDKEREMGVTSSEAVQRIHKLVELVEEKRLSLVVATSNYNRLKIEIDASLRKCEKDFEAAKDSLQQVRKQLEVELVKFDPALFIEKAEEPCLKKS
jgi:16S rRNA G966 N2-methylase RsmD